MRGCVRVYECAWVCQRVCAEVWNLLPDYLWNYIHRYSLGLYWNLQLHAHDHNWLSLIAKNKFCGCCLHLQLQWNCSSPMGCICAFNCFLSHIKCLKAKQTWADSHCRPHFPTADLFILNSPVCGSDSIESHITSSIIKRQSRAIWIIQTWLRTALWDVYNAENVQIRTVL